MKDWTLAKHALIGALLLLILPLSTRAQPWLTPFVLDLSVGSGGAHMMLKYSSAS
jgi:hypothetical protein